MIVRLANSRALVTLLLITGALWGPHAGAQHPTPAELKYFTPVRSVIFDVPDTLLIATIDHLDVDASGRLLVTDKLGQQVLLFDSTGALLASLDPRVCHPGFTFRPVKAMFGGSEFILLFNAGPWGYRFTSDGACLGGVHSDFGLSKFVDIDPKGGLIGVVDGPEWEVRQMDGSGKPLNSFPVAEPKFPNASYRFSGGGLVADGFHVYFAWAPEPTVMKYTLDGEFVRRIRKSSRYFRSQHADMPFEVSPEQVAALRNWTGTFTLALYELSEHLIMVQYLDNRSGTGYQVFSKDGELVAEELGIGGWFFIHGGNGLAYGLFQPDLDDQRELPNPFITVYKFLPPQ
ncbi:MAG: hypothetical protein OXM02_13900 [Bacteroidota bacterium]|nr:hypothetical protein [Bacteroidota bacterium]MDE2835591.1 hypothetical protein [Bacteroidota bacterium]MDE2957863.1 hypothetical protein [Bacteroidota bacterium]